MVDMVTWQPGGETARTFDLMGSAGIQGALFAIKSSLLILDFLIFLVLSCSCFSCPVVLVLGHVI